MVKSWASLIEMLKGEKILVEKIKLIDSQISIQGEFELPPLAKLKIEDQVFVTAFIKNHGSIKDMELNFGVSYPTIKNRLNKIADQLDYLEVKNSNSAQDVLEKLERGEINIQQALEDLRK